MNKMIMTTITVVLCVTLLRGNDAERLEELERICAFVPSDDLFTPEVIPTPDDIIAKYYVTTNQIAMDLKVIAAKYTAAETNEYKRGARATAISCLSRYGGTNDLAFLATIMTNRGDYAQDNAVGASIGILKHSPELVDFAHGIVTNTATYNYFLRCWTCILLKDMCEEKYSSYVEDLAQRTRIAAFFVDQVGLPSDLAITMDKCASELNPWYRHSQQRRDNLARLRPPGLTGRPAEIYDAAQRDAAQED